jgi:hypothetical protein
MGDGCGFKIGGQEIGTAIGGVQRTLYNCISAYNSLTGFDANYGSVRLDNSLYNCISYNDITSGYHFVQPGAVSTLKNCVEYSTYNSRVYEGVSSNIEDHNSWDSNLGVTVDNNDFVNTDYTQLAGQRKADGSLPDITFLHLAANSDLINKGTPISGRTSDGYGQTIFGNPDLGAFEHP